MNHDAFTQGYLQKEANILRLGRAILPGIRAVGRYAAKGSKGFTGGRAKALATAADMTPSAAYGIHSYRSEKGKGAGTSQAAIKGIMNAAIVSPYFWRSGIAKTRAAADPISTAGTHVVAPIAAKLALPEALDILSNVKTTTGNVKGITSSASSVSDEVAKNIADASKSVANASTALDTTARKSGDVMDVLSSLGQTIGSSQKTMQDIGNRGVDALNNMGTGLGGIGDLSSSLSGLIESARKSAGNIDQKKAAVLGIAALLTGAGVYGLSRPRTGK